MTSANFSNKYVPGNKKPEGKRPWRCGVGAVEVKLHPHTDTAADEIRICLNESYVVLSPLGPQSNFNF